MTRNAVRSLTVAQRRALAGEKESQDSQENLLFLIREHGIGVTTSSLTLDDELRWSVKGIISAPTSQPVARRPQPQHLENASRTHANITTNAYADADAATNTVASVERSRSSQQLAKPRLSAPVSIPARSDSRDARPVDKQTSPQTRDDGIPRPVPPTAPLTKKKKKKDKAMSSQASTQPNEGRSYEQYAHDDSQPSSPPGSFAEEHRTLHEGDTGYVDLKCAFELPDTAPVEPDMLFPHDSENDGLPDPSQSQSQFTSQPTTTRIVPETPAALPKPFLASGNGQVLPASQLFDQTQPTSALRKASPTSSRPSPNVFGNHVTSPTQPASSPLKDRGLGTGPPPTYVSASPGAAERSSRPLAEGRDEEEEEEMDAIPLLPFISRKGRVGLEPIEEYQPYRKQDVYREAARSSSQQSFDSDFDEDDTELRRQRVRWIKERATRSFPGISLPLSSSSRARIEVPSTNRAGRPKDPARTKSEKYIAWRHGNSDATDRDVSQETVGDSQDTTVVGRKSTNETATPVLPARHLGKSLREIFDLPPSVPAETVEDKETIPETSPAPTLAEPPRLIGDLMRENSGASSGLLTLSYPTPTAGACAEPSSSSNMPALGSERHVSAPPVVDQTVDGRDPDSITMASSPSIVPASAQQSIRRRSSRLNHTATPSSTAPAPLLHSDPGTASSALTVMSTTPAVSSSATPNSEANHGEDPPDDTVSVPSPAVERGRRRGRPPSSLPNPSPSSTPTKTHRRPRQTFRKGVRQSSRHSSLSPDELGISPTASASEDSRAVARKSPRKLTTLREVQTKPRIFEGMVFAVSLQERQPPPRSKDRPLSKGSLEEMIRQQGGTVLDDGFNALFEFDTLPPTTTKPSSAPVLSSSLNLLDSETGFAALIADGHSRKVKYMQALALGIPCLAPRWVTTCVAKKEIVDWSSYLLCAGSSALLGDAIRSRNLQPYDASTARLAQVVSQRPKLLNEGKILLIMKKTKNGKRRLPYVFLAQVLGASLVRVNSVEEARAKLREAESKEDAFDWVYVDDHLQDAKTALFGSASGEGPSKKRKRPSAVADAGDEPPKRIRTLNDELVVQSLILGRLIEEDEIES